MLIKRKHRAEDRAGPKVCEGCGRLAQRALVLGEVPRREDSRPNQVEYRSSGQRRQPLPGMRNTVGSGKGTAPRACDPNSSGLVRPLRV